MVSPLTGAITLLFYYYPIYGIKNFWHPLYNRNNVPMPSKFLLLVFSIFVIGCREYPQYPEGGYLYPKNVTDKNRILYNYHIRDSMTPLEKWRDDYTYIYYGAFNEPNLSIRPLPKETFRFVFSDAFEYSVMITFNRDSMIVKKGNPTVLYENDTTRLSAIENLHLRILNRRFPIDTTGKKPHVKRYLDSMVKLYPQLLDPAYYHKIFDKYRVSTGEKFTPVITRMPLSKQQYTSLIQEINSSGFWSLPWRIDCKAAMADGYGFHLEANTKTKYKVVYVMGCPDDSSKFTKACQKIIDATGQDKMPDLTWSWGTPVNGDSIEIQSVELEEIKPKKKRR